MDDPVTLDALAAAVGGSVRGDGSTAVGDVTHDSDHAGPGTLFVAIRGHTRDGHEFVELAVQRGVPAVCVETPAAASIPQLVVADTRKALGRLAAEVHHHPSRRLEVVGVTGTNGKTAVTHLVEDVMAAVGRRPGRIGTTGAAVAGTEIPLQRTTPEATDWQRLLRRMADAGVDVVAAEVSSHALALSRVAATEFAVAAFTNLTQDHLDYHGTMERYFETKATLFSEHEVRHRVIWIDDGWGSRLADRHEDARRVGRRVGDVHARDVESTMHGITFRLVTPEGEADVELPLPGDFQLDNALIAAACCGALGSKPEAIAMGLAAAAPIPGRFEPVDVGQDFLLVVDYAHTPAGIERAVEAARRAGAHRVIVVVGAGGERDTGKRPLMGSAAASADVVIITSDNPRSEDPRVIADTLSKGAQGAGATPRVELDRRVAIRIALAEADPGDAVLVLGKGHETGQDVGEQVVAFDDRRVAREELERR